MANGLHPSFNQESISQALDAAQRHAQEHSQVRAAQAAPALQHGTLKLSAQCISVTVQNNKVCLDLPLGIGSVCLPIPISFPNGTAAQACLDICTTWGIPCGVEVTVSIAGVTIVSQHFGCSC